MFNQNQKSETLLITIMVLFSIAIIYAIYVFNPYFMNRKPLSESLTERQVQSVIIPKANATSESLGPWPFLKYKNISTTNTASSEIQMSAIYVRESVKELPRTIQDNEPAPIWTTGENGFYFSYTDEIFKTDYNSELIWKFKLEEGDRLAAYPIEGLQFLFFSTTKGFIYKLNRNNGKLVWLFKDMGAILHSFLPYNSFLFYITKESDSKFFISKINGHTGEILWKNELLGFTNPSSLTINDEHKLVMLSDPNGSMLSLDLNTGNAYWQAKKLGEIYAPPSTVGEYIYVVNREGIVYSLNIKKKQIAWEYTLHSGSDSSFAYIPSYGLIAAITDSGYLHTIESRTGEGHWKYNTNNSQELKSLMAARYDNKAISKYKLNWSHKGWAVISPCSESFICSFNPEKGQLIGRTRLYGELISSNPEFIQDKLYVILKNPQPLPWIKSSTPMPNYALATFKTYKEVKVSTDSPSGE